MISCIPFILLLTTQATNQLVELQKIDSSNLKVFYQKISNMPDSDNWLEITSNINTTVTAISVNCTNSFNRFNTTNSTDLLFNRKSQMVRQLERMPISNTNTLHYTNNSFVNQCSLSEVVG